MSCLRSINFPLNTYKHNITRQHEMLFLHIVEANELKLKANSNERVSTRALHHHFIHQPMIKRAYMFSVHVLHCIN